MARIAACRVLDKSVGVTIVADLRKLRHGIDFQNV